MRECRFALVDVFTETPLRGNPVAVVPGADMSRPDAQALRRVLAQADAQGCYVYSLDPSDPANTAYAQFFNPTVGIS